MLMLKPTSRDDFVGFEPIELQVEEMAYFVSDHFDESLPHMFTLYDEEGIVLFAGFKEMWPGVYDSYTIFSTNWRPVYYRALSKLLKKYLKFIKYDRIQHIVSCDRPWTHKMAKIMGMTCETPDGMGKYVFGKTRYMYSIVSD